MAKGNPEDVKVCNCAECKCDLLAAGQALLLDSLTKAQRDELPQCTVYGHINGRPYCTRCLEATHCGNGSRGGRVAKEETLPGQDNAIRSLEDTRDL